MKYQTLFLTALVSLTSAVTLNAAPVTLDDVYHAINVLDDVEYDKHASKNSVEEPSNDSRFLPIIHSEDVESADVDELIIIETYY